MTGIIITAIICTTVVLLVWLGGRNAKAGQVHGSAVNPTPTRTQETRFGSNNRDGSK